MVLVMVIAEAREDSRPKVIAVEVRILRWVCARCRKDLEEVRYRCVRLASAYAGQVDLRTGEVARCADMIAVVMIWLRDAFA